MYCGSPNHVDNWSFSDNLDSIGDGRHTILPNCGKLGRHLICSCKSITRLALCRAGTVSNGYCDYVSEEIDKDAGGLENRRFSYVQGSGPVTTLVTTNLGALPFIRRGKVRDLYAVDSNLLLVATDRISAFDHVLATGIPDKGKILTQISLFWFDLLRDIVPNHLITANVDQYPEALRPYADQLRGRSMLVQQAQMFPIECVARGYLSGSGWKEYQAAGQVCGIKLPPGLLEGSQLPEPIFTPATKSQDGSHDENISFSATEKLIGAADAAELRRLTLAIYHRAAQHAESRGLILADTKFEFGRTADGVILADEVLTPDSSRFWDAEAWRPGGAQPSFDKQFVRDYLESIHWNKQAPAPGLPGDVVERTRGKYIEAFRRLTGKELAL